MRKKWFPCLCDAAFLTMALAISLPSQKKASPVSAEVAVDSVATIAAGFHHSLALTSSGKLFAFGDNGYYQLGDQTKTDSSTPKLIADSLGEKEITSIATGQNHVLAINSSGALYGWGSNSSYQLGNGTTTDIELPTLLAETLGGNTISSVACGYYHSFAITSTGELYAWGNNWVSQIGDGTSDDKPSPTLIASTLGGETIAKAAGGHINSLALTSSGKLYAWGDNSWGQIGIGRQYGSYKTPTFIASTLGGNTITSISLGFRHCLALTSTGSVYSWGRNDYGQLGIGNYYEYVTSPTLISASAFNNEAVIAISAGDNHSLALTSTGKVYSFGYNNSGQLGDGGNVTYFTPHLSFSTVGGASVATITAGYCHGLCISSAHKLYSWGGNGCGELGIGTTTLSRSPVKVTFLGPDYLFANNLSEYKTCIDYEAA